MEKIKYRSIETKNRVRNRIVREIKKGRIFIYPTDTVYGLGCNAMKFESVARLREIKQTSHPLSVIAPSKDWVRKNFRINNTKHLTKLPGPYTLIAEKKKQVFMFWVGAPKTLGIRIPDHPFTRLVEKAGVPFITTSANLTGGKIPRATNDIVPELRNAVDYIIDAGRLGAKPSTILDITGKRVKVIRK